MLISIRRFRPLPAMKAMLRRTFLIEQVKKRRAEGVIFALQFCDPALAGATDVA